MDIMRFAVVRPRNAAIALVYFGIMGMLLVALISNWDREYGWFAMLSFAVWATAFVGMFHQCVYKRIYIDAMGVTYRAFRREYRLAWDEMSIIGIGYMPRSPGKNPWIYFSTDDVARPMFTASMVGPRFLVVQHRDRFADAIRRYWSGDIAGLDSECAIGHRARKAPHRFDNDSYSIQEAT